MINAERLQDAIGLLPEELLSPVDALRQRKKVYWKPIAAVAASLLLVVGLWQLQPAQKSADKGSALEDAAERGDGFVEEFAGNSIEQSTTLSACFLPAQITEIHDTYWVVTLPAGESAKVFFDNLEECNDFSVGDEITLCFNDEPKKPTELYPNEIFLK